MQFSQSLILGFLIITAISGIIGVVSLYQFVTIVDSLKTAVPESIEDFKTKASILESDRLIIYYDEVLTQSARNYAFTHDEKWKLRYFQIEPVLDKLIQEPYGNANNSIFLELDKINIQLVNMEKEAIKLTDDGEYEQAISILESDEYTEQKSLYTDSLKLHAENNNLEYNDGIKSLENTSLLLSSNIDRVTKEGTIVLEIIFPILVSLSIFLGIFFSKRLATPINDLKKSVKQITAGNFDVDIAVHGPDEIKELIHDFKTMVIELNKIDIMKNDFSAMVTHELKTPLVPIIGYVDLLLSKHFGDLNQNQIERLLRIKNSCIKMQNMVTDILDINGIGTNQLKFNMEINDISLIVKDGIEQLKDEFSKRNITIVESLEKNLMCNCDKDRINQVIVNVLSNAIDFCPKQEGRIEIITNRIRNNVHITIKDNGIGISQENLDKIFVKYYQVDTTSTREHGGTGIGLSLSKIIIENHNGKIWAESNGKDNGSEIHIQIPTI